MIPLPPCQCLLSPQYYFPFTALDALGRTVPSCTGRTWTHYDKWKSQLSGTELALNNFKQNDHITYFDGAEFKYELCFPIQ